MAEKKLPLLVSKTSISQDPVLQEGKRGARKLSVTQMYPLREIMATSVHWAADYPCPVVSVKETEIAHFTNHCSQDRHYHAKATEIYMVLEGTMSIEIEKTNYHLSDGDMIIVPPGLIHEIAESRLPFLCRVITTQCEGASDKFIVE